jgi:hypothetical protein
MIGGDEHLRLVASHIQMKVNADRGEAVRKTKEIKQF